MSTQPMSGSLGSGRALGCVVALGATAVVLVALRRRASKPEPKTAQETVVLAQLARERVPRGLRSEFYFDFASHPFLHSSLITDAHDVVAVLDSIQEYAVTWLERNSKAVEGASGASSAAPSAKIVGREPPVHLEEGGLFSPDVFLGATSGLGLGHGLHVSRGAQVLGGTFDVRAGGIFLGVGATVEPGVYVAGPAIIGGGTTLRTGAYVRGNVVVGDDAVLRGELKNAVVMNKAELAHPGYCGDSIIGFKGHFGCQALTANLGLFGAELSVQVHNSALIRPPEELLH